MKLSSVYHILAGINFSSSRMGYDRETESIKNLSGFKAFIEKITEVPAFKDEIQDFASSQIYATSQD